MAYIAQKNLGVELSVIRCLTKLRSTISQSSIELARQATLDEFEFVNIEYSNKDITEFVYISVLYYRN